MYEPLLQPSRYKALYGGRGSGKSHFCAEDIVEHAVRRPGLRAACIREVQKTLKESVKRLIETKIRAMGVGHLFEIRKGEAEIITPGDGRILFTGMQSYNADNIKSLEDIDIAWVEEAQTLSERSLRLLRPTIRKPGSEIWFSWNPRFETDAVDEFFRGSKPPTNAIIVRANLEDNPWATDVLWDERNEDFERDPEMARHVWDGEYEFITEGAYYARHIAAAEADGRVGDFPHNPRLPVRTAWDIGVDDYTAIWFFQDDGLFHTAIDYYEVNGLGAEDIVSQALPELMPDLQDSVEQRLLLGRPKPYRYTNHYLPHDVKVREWGAGARSRVETLQGLGVTPIAKGAAVGPEERINAGRALLPATRFNRTSRVMLGLNRLRRYSRKQNKMGMFLGPAHDENSHGADAFGEYAVNRGVFHPPPPPKPRKQPKGTIVLDVPSTTPARRRLKL